MASPQGREMAGWAFRAGANYKPAMLVDQANKQQQANKAAQQKAIADKRKESKKFLEKAATLDKSALSEPYQKYKMKKASELLGYSKEKLMKNDGMLSSDDQLEILEMKNSINNEVELLESYDRGLKDIQNTILRDKNLYNMEEVSEYLLTESQKALTENGLNPDFSLSDLQNGLQNPDFLNASAVFEQFTGRIEEQRLSDIDGNEKRLIDQKFAEYDPAINDFKRDENGNIRVKVNPQTVALAKTDSKIKSFLDKRIATEREAGNEKYSYSDALSSFLGDFQKADVTQTNKTPKGNDSGLSINDFEYVKSDNVRADKEITEGQDLAGVQNYFMDVQGLNLNNLELRTKNPDGSEQVVRGNLNRFTTDADGNPIAELVSRNSTGDYVVEQIPFDESNYKAIRNTAKNSTQRKVIDKAWNKRNDLKGNMYVSPKKKNEIEFILSNLTSKNETDWAGGDVRSNEELQSQVIQSLNQLGIPVTEQEIKGDASYIKGTNNEVKFDGNTYTQSNIKDLVIALANKYKKSFLVDEKTYNIQRGLTDTQTESSKDERGGAY